MKTLCNSIRHLAWAALLCLPGLVNTLASSGRPQIRPPAVPLVAHNPCFSIWSPADRLTDADTVHWTGRPHRLTALARINGQTFRIMGAEPADLPALPQTALEVLPTRTIYTFDGQGLRLTLTFLTPSLPADLDLLSRPVTYLTFTLQSTGDRPQEVALQLDVHAELVVNEPRQLVTWSATTTDRLAIARLGSLDQPVLARKGDDVRIDWGHLYLAAPRSPGATLRLASPESARRAFSTRTDSLAPAPLPPAPALDAPAAVWTSDSFQVNRQPVSRRVWLAYDDEFSIKYFREQLRPGWRRDGTDAVGLLEAAGTDYPGLVDRCAAFDARLLEALERVGGPRYAALCALAYRQTLAGNQIVADTNGQPLMFPKENFSNGCIGTVDVLFPQAPFFLLFSPALTKAMLVPVLDYAASPLWPYPYAPHDLGTYPHATGQVYGMGGSDGDRMPVEECGNMLIMLAALARLEGHAALAELYWPMLTQWADYLVQEGLDPRNQLCSADMFGHLPRNANLALKAILAIGGFARLCELTDRPDDARRYHAIARDYARRWIELAADEGRTRLAYHQPGTWSMKHNLIWDRILDLHLFPDPIAEAEVAWYLKVQQPFGLPVDSRTETSLIDWALWSIALARDDADFQTLLNPIYRYVNETPTRVPLSDWFITTNGQRQGFQARPVVGGLFIRMLADPPTWTAWAARGANTAGPWAPIPAGRPFIEVVPTARTATVTWRYTTETPPENWFTPAFDDSGWKEGTGGFGTEGTPGALIGTVWNTPQIWLRRSFTLPERPLENPRLLVIYDEDPRLYLNGVRAARQPGWVTTYEEVDIAPAALATLKPGRNLLAIHATQTYGGQSIDAGLVEDASPGLLPIQPDPDGRVRSVTP